MKLKAETEKLQKALTQVAVLKMEISKKRDELRSAVEEVEEIVRSMDEADEELEAGFRAFSRAVDALSERL